MSVDKFTKALRNRALKEWFNNEKAGGGSASKEKREEYALENINVLTNNVKVYRRQEQSSEKTSFIITIDTIKKLLQDFKDMQEGPELNARADELFKQFRRKNAGVRVNRKKITVEGAPAIYFPNIGFDSITTLVNSIVGLKPKELATKYEKGHVVGLTTELLQATTERLRQVNTAGAFGKDFLTEQLDKVVEYYKRLDLQSANIQPASQVSVYASVNKKISKSGKTRYLVELQPREKNQESAKEVAATITSIRKLFSLGYSTEAEVLELIKSLKKSVTDQTFLDDLANMESSPSYKDMLGKYFASVIDGNPIDQEVSHINATVGTKKPRKIDLSPIRKEIKNEINKAEALKRKIKSVKRSSVRDRSGRFYSVALLKDMINSVLAEVIEENMGTGRRRDILNFQSGSFANSASVEKVSVSRSDMLVIFYTYMKYPYQTFEPGFRQGYPLSRDPKLLISKSIREIAATRVSNKIRAVRV